MAEEKAAPKSFSFDEAKVKAKFDTVKKGINAKIGVRGYNPYLWANKEVNPLYARFTGDAKSDPPIKPERTEQLQNAILALPDEPPQLTTPEPVVAAKAKISTPGS